METDENNLHETSLLIQNIAKVVGAFHRDGDLPMVRIPTDFYLTISMFDETDLGTIAMNHQDDDRNVERLPV